MKSFTRLAATVAVTLVAFGANAAEKLKFAHVYEVGTPYHEAALKAAEAFEERTDGRYQIEVFPASSLGKEDALNEGLSLGTVDIIYTGAGFASAVYGPLAISDFPFTLRGYAHWKAYGQSDLFKELSEGYKNASGNSIVALTYYGARHVTANKAIKTPEDMKGLKIRVPNAPAYMLFPQATGANPTPMAFSEVYLALQQGVVDAQENPLPTIKFKKFYEVQSDISLTGHVVNSLVTVISGMRMASLAEEDLATLTEVLQDAADWASQEILSQEESLADWFRGEGLNVHEVDRKPFQEMVEPALVGDDMPWEPSIYERLQAIPDAE
jgi:tripartite ATP-independent transporter DctP family solute receptor